MKKTFLLLAFFAFQAIGAMAQGLNINTTLNGAGEGVEVTVYELTYNPATMDSSMTEFCVSSTNADGLAQCTSNTEAPAGWLAVSFVNCYGDITYNEFYFDATAQSTYAFNLDYCPEEEVSCGIYFNVDSIASTDYNIVLGVSIEGTPTSYYWEFGDGSTSTEVYPSYTYLTTGSYNVCLSITTSEGCVLTQCVMISISDEGILGGGAQQAFTLNVVEGQLLAVEDESPSASLSVYPNPAVDQARVMIAGAAAGKAEVCLYNLAGQQISRETKAISGNQTLVDVDLSNQKAGYYMVKVVFENGASVSQSIIKK